MKRRLAASALTANGSTFSTEPISCRSRMTASPAPPWSGPLIVAIPATTAEYMSERVEAATRAAKLEAFISCSA